MSTPPFLDLPPGVRADRLTTDRAELAVLTAGDDTAAGSDPVLLVPGFTGSKEDFIAVVAPLAAAGYRVVAIDLRGQHESPGVDDPQAYDLKEIAEDVLSVASALGQPVHLVGHSFGGLVARAAALADPAALRSLVLMCSGPAAMPEPSSGDVALLLQALGFMDLPAIWTAKRQIEQQRGLADPPADIEAFLRRRFLNNHPVALRRHAEQLLAEPDGVAELAELRLPVLVAYGVDDDAWPPAVQADMAARLAAPIAAIADAGHSPAVDQPAATVEALASFWSGL